MRVRGWVLDRWPAPKPFDFQVMPGELWMLVGTVSSGRRELIYSVAGLIEPRAGHLELFGHDIARLGPRSRGIAQPDRRGAGAAGTGAGLERV